MSAHLHDHPFKFYRIRGGQETRIYPHAGARLHFGSREADSLVLPTLPVGTLAAGDQVKVTYLETPCFIGTVEKRVLRKTGGSEQTETVTVLGPWSKMARLVYRQGWLSMGAAARSSRLILNQTQAGTPQSLNSELTEIANHAATSCGYSVGTISVSTQILPSDECRDITVADAIRRELRLFPKAVARFDYSSGTPTLVINKGSAANYDVADKTEREIEYDEHPITGVDLEIAASGEVDGVPYLNITHQTAGDTTAGNPDCLYATLQIKGASSNTVRQSFKSVTEAVPGDLNSVGWWKQKHPRLANVALAAIKSITEGTRTPSTYSRISAATAGELEEAGLKCEVSKFTCKVTIETTDDKEEDIYLTAHFLTTNAEGTASNPKTYTWVSESSAESGETVPAGLARTILAERCGSIRSEKMTIRLGQTFPAIGDTITDEGQTLPLQSFDVDCADLTAELVFGAPEYLSPEDMAALLSNFRNKCTTSSSSLRKTGKTEDQGANVEMGGIPPLSSTEFQPGTKSKTTVAQSSSASSSGGSSGSSASSIVLDTTGSTPKLLISDGTKSISLDLKDIDEECAGALKINKLKFKDKDGNEHTYHGLFCGEIDLTKIGKTIKDTTVTASADPNGMNTIRFNYTDGTYDDFHVMNGMNGEAGSPGDKGDTPEITSDRNGKLTNIYADGELIASIADGDTPNITAQRTGEKQTTIFADERPIAVINDGEDGQGGEDEFDEMEVVSGISFEFSEDGKTLKAKVSKKKIKAVFVEDVDPVDIPVMSSEGIDVVVQSTYNANGDFKFKNVCKRIKVVDTPADAQGQDVFTTTPLSGEAI